MKTMKFNVRTHGRPGMIALAVALFCCVGCSDVYDGPFIPEERTQSFSGNVGIENVVLEGSRVTALDGLVTLSFGGTIPAEPQEIFVATFPVNHLDLGEYITTGRGYYLSFGSEGYAVQVELRYDEELLKSTMDHFREEDLTICRLVTEDPYVSTEEKVISVGLCEVDPIDNVVRGSIHQGGTFILVQE